MIFTTPLPFEEAIQSREVRQLLPTDFRTALLKEIPAELRERAFFSAGVTNARYLQEIDDRIDQIVAGKADRATMRAELKQILDSMGYKPVEGEEGTLTDLSSDLRINLQLDQNVEDAQGYGHWKQGQDEAILENWPAQELIRVIDSKEKRDWAQIWADNGGQFFNGRMIALKDDPIWVAISEFGRPWPPFRFGSGMDVEGVSLDECIEIGLLTGPVEITPQDRGFNDSLQAALGVGDDIARAVQSLFGDRATVLDGVLRWVGGAL
jgi:hypothetical protein